MALRRYFGFWVGAAVVLIGAVVWTGSLVRELDDWLDRLPADAQLLDKLEGSSNLRATEVWSRDGERLGEFAEERRYYLPLTALPAIVGQAFVAAEDRDFYSHSGVSWRGIGRAVMANISAGRIVQGASTITQQLVRLSFLSPRRTLVRKIKEVVLAFMIEARLPKERILELYLNAVYLGNRAYGIEAAARRYFGRSARTLRPEEAALLAGLTKAPSRLAPHRHPERARIRQRQVLAAMAEEGYLTAAAVAALPDPKVISPPRRQGSSFLAWVQRRLSRRFERRTLPGDGWRVETTLDHGLQQHLGAVLARHLGPKPTGLEAAVIAIDSASGAILGYQGGRDFRRSQFDRVVGTRRPLAELMIPWLTVVALQEGYHLLQPVRRDPLGEARGKPGPRLLDLIIAGEVSAFAAPFAVIGLQPLLRLGQRVGFRSWRRGFHLLSEGGRASPWTVARAFATLREGGRPVVPYGLARVAGRDGETVYRHQGQRPAAALATEELFVVDYVWRRLARVRGRSGLVAVTPDRKDGWYVDRRGGVIVALWVGAEYGRTPLARTRTAAAQWLASWGPRLLQPPRPLPEFARPGARVPPRVAFGRARHGEALLTLPFVVGREPEGGR